MSGEGKLCYKPNDGRLCFKRDGDGRLIFKADEGLPTTITFAWGQDGKDLDICAYWVGNSGRKVGYAQGNSGGTEYVDNEYHLKWSGDVTSEQGSEWCQVSMSPWSSGNSREFRVHFNFYGADEDHPGGQCTVIAVQPGGKSLTKQGQGCSTAHGRAANTGDPSCTVKFDESGKLVSIS